MKNTQNVTIAVLTVTACILLAMVLGSFLADRATAGVPSIKQGDYIMGTGAYSNDRDLLYLIDIAARRLNVYWPNINTNSLELVDKVDLQQAFSEKP